MVEFLIAAMQVLCIVGLLCGAYLSITYAPETDAVKTPARYDPVTTHAWSVPSEPSDHVRA